MAYPHPVSPTRRFAPHLGEMVAGMAVLALPAGAALGAMGDPPALWLVAMATSMTAPMVAWMRHRGHGARATAEMAASMVIPAVAPLGLLAAGIVEDAGVLMGLQHAAM